MRTPPTNKESGQNPAHYAPVITVSSLKITKKKLERKQYSFFT
jgi:hypothetical protein